MVFLFPLSLGIFFTLVIYLLISAGPVIIWAIGFLGVVALGFFLLACVMAGGNMAMDAFMKWCAGPRRR